MFFTAKYDRVFRSIFIDDNDHELLEGLLSTCLDSKIKIIKLLKTELSVNSNKERVKRLDLLVKSLDSMINLELNTNSNLAIKVRNLNYFSSFYSSNTSIGNDYDTKTSYIHIDLFYDMNFSKPDIDEYYLYSKISDDLYVDNFKIITINMDKIMQYWFDNDLKMIKKYDLLIMLNLEPSDLDRLEMIGHNKELIKKYKEKVCKLNEDYDFLAPVSAERDYIMLLNTEKKLELEEANKQGKLENKLQVIKNMQKAKFTKEQILTSLGIAEDEYNRILSMEK